MTYIGVKVVEFADKVLIKLGMTSFGKALVYMAVILTVIFTILMTIAIITIRRSRAIAMNGNGLGSAKSRLNKALEMLILTISTVIPISAALPINSVYRFFGYFILTAIDAALITIYIANNGQKRAYLLYAITTILLTAVTSVFIKNHFFGEGLPYDFREEALYTQGTLTTYQLGAIQGGFYYFIPTDALNLVTIGFYTDLIDPMEILFDSLFAIVTVLSLIVLFERLKVRSSVLAAFLIFVPPLSFLVARIGSLPYTAMALLSVVMMIMGAPIMSTSIIYVLSALDAVFAHPVGPIAATATLLIAYLTIPFIKVPGEEKAKVKSIIGKALATLMIIEFTYWVGVDIAIFLIMEKVNRTINALHLFTTTVLGGKIGTLYNISPVVAPGYSSPEVRVYVYVWALPIALSLTLVLFVLFYGINRMNRLNTMSWFGLVIGFSASLSSVLATALGYADYTAGMATGQYLLPVAYFLALIGAGIAMSILLRSRSRFVMVVFTLLFMVFAFLGVYSPDWAPLENSSIFHVVAMIHPYYVFKESTQLRLIIPHDISFYAQDGLPFGSQGKLQTGIILHDFSTCSYNTLLGVYMNQVPQCVLSKGDLSLMTTQGYAILTSINN